MKFSFRREAAKAAASYIIRALHERLGEKPTRHQVFKLLYFADKLHLERYGRPITGEQYIAMEHGPVPEHFYNVVKKVYGTGKEVPDIEADLNELSKSELKILDEVINDYAYLGFRARTEISHDPAWEKAYEQALLADKKAHPIEWADIIKNLPNSEEITEYLNHLYD